MAVSIPPQRHRCPIHDWCTEPAHGHRVHVGEMHVLTTARGIEITHMEYEVEGDFDVRPFLGMPGQRPGFSRIRATGRVSSPNATREQLEQLIQQIIDRVDCAVHMRRLPEARMLDRLLAENAVSREQILSLAHTMAQFHQRAAKEPCTEGAGSPEALRSFARANFEETREFST